MAGGQAGTFLRHPAHVPSAWQALLKLRGARSSPGGVLARAAPQVCKEALQQLTAGGGPGAAGGGLPPSPRLSVGLTSQLLHSQLALGYRPPTRQLMTLLAAVAPHVDGARLADVAGLLGALGACGVHPGAGLLEQLLERAGGQQDALDARSASVLLFACAQLGHDAADGRRGEGAADVALLAHAADVAAVDETSLDLTESCRCARALRLPRRSASRARARCMPGSDWGSGRGACGRRGCCVPGPAAAGLRWLGAGM